MADNFRRGRMVRNTLLPAGELAGKGRVLATTTDYRGHIYVVVQWPRGYVGCSRPRNLELLKDEVTP